MSIIWTGAYGGDRKEGGAERQKSIRNRRSQSTRKKYTPILVTVLKGLLKSNIFGQVQEKIYEILKGWAGVPTWYTGHPADNTRRSAVLEQLYREVGPDISLTDFIAAIKKHNKDNVEILGGKPLPDKFINSIQDAWLEFKLIGLPK